MSTSLPGFDDWLNRSLEECARNAGEDLDTYVARAVARQMMADKVRTDKISTRELLDHLSECGVLETDLMPDVSAVIADPDRLRSVRATGLLDTPPEEVYDRITRAAADALDVPFAALSLVDVDRQFFKSTAGLGDMPVQESQTPLDQSICQFAVAAGTPLVLEDARSDPVFRNHPVVRSGAVIAYLGIPLNDHDGNAIGTLCVFDSKPRLWGTGHVQVLSDLAQLAAERIFGPLPAPSQ
ncbi:MULTISPECIES: GAF domain-containing protein [unclassified Mycobacterium]|uniref:GAF domain-containing protein n=1 Tax=unclassified Mycobacterium TaxID=2642494 RepID=UPI000A7BB7C5|nr:MULTISPECIES: GAF domain-containing protein [unclassified Mycobacterium]